MKYYFLIIKRGSLSRGDVIMQLTVQEFLDFDALSDSKLIAGKDGLMREVTGIMVMEASDIESWGNTGQIILTSFFALKDFTEDETKEFFVKTAKIGIAAIVVKVDRLVQMIPDYFIDQCNLYSIPLIKITKETKYESIILKVMEFLINQNKVLLDYYYDINKELTTMALNEPQFIHIIEYLKEITGKDVSLYKNYKSTNISTNELFDSFKVIQSILLPKKRYTTFSYKKQTVIYEHFDKSREIIQLIVEIPSISIDTYQLVIHHLSENITEKDFMAIENTVGFLQMELIKKYALHQQNLNHFNELVNDLIFGRFQSKEEMTEILNYLRFTNKDLFNIVIIDILNDTYIDETRWHDTTSIAKNLTNYISLHWKKYVYLVKKSKIVFLIANAENEVEFKKKIVSTVRSFIASRKFSELTYNIGISSKTTSDNLPNANQQANNILRLLKNNNKKNQILAYDNLGIFRIFIETSNINELKSFIPNVLLEIEEKNPELNRTLKVFLDHKQNYTLTAGALYIHPKTAKYRIERFIQLTETNLEDPEELLQINIGLRLLEFINNNDNLYKE